MHTVDIYYTPPPNFRPTLSVAACYLTTKNTLLLLQQASCKPDRESWGAPGGKQEKGETIEQTARRELFEETGIEHLNLVPIGMLYVRTLTIDYILYLFGATLSHPLSVSLSTEHQQYEWVSFDKLDTLLWRAGGKEFFSYYLEYRKHPMPHRAHLLLNYEGHILLTQRESSYQLFYAQAPNAHLAKLQLLADLHHQAGLHIEERDLELFYINPLHPEERVFRCGKWRIADPSSQHFTALPMHSLPDHLPPLIHQAINMHTLTSSSRNV